MRNRPILKERGVTLIELLVALVISGVVVGAIYRLFVVQTRAYTVQDEVVEIQQNVRGVMELLLRDLRMTGYDDDSLASTVTIPTAIVTPVQDSAMTVNYEYSSGGTFERHSVNYSWNAGTLTLTRQVTIDAAPGTIETLLQDVNAFDLDYGIDPDEDGDVDNWVDAVGVGISKIIAVRVTLTARPTSPNPDVQTRVSPRTLTSAVTLRNCIMR
jgi:prepilin-type N-terminal cleavage/methylation domain-containing protein